MKGDSGSVWRTVLLVAFMCLAAGEAYGYEVWKGGDASVNSGVLVVEDDCEIGIVAVREEGCLIIKPDASVKVLSRVYSYTGSKIYVFGQLDVNNVKDSSFQGVIYVMFGGGVLGNLGSEGTIVSLDKDETLAMISTKRKVGGQMPSRSNGYVGWKDYYGIGMEADGDFISFSCYEDEQYTKPIDFEKWKDADGKLEGYYFTLGDANYHAAYTEGELVLDGDVVFPDKAEYRCDEDDILVGKTNTIAYSREFKSTGVWQCWFVPFEVRVDEEQFDAAEVAGILMDDEGNTVVAFRKMAAGALMKAGTPYVVRAKKNSVAIKAARNKLYKASMRTDVDLRSAYDDFLISGIYEWQSSDEGYTLNTSGKFMQMAADARLAPQRFWLTVSPRTNRPYGNGAVTSAARQLYFTVLGDGDGTTGVVETDFGVEKKADIYNLQGQKVTEIASGEIYIMDGRKFVAE